MLLDIALGKFHVDTMQILDGRRSAAGFGVVVDDQGKRR
jgi:hypothetical protein